MAAVKTDPTVFVSDVEDVRRILDEGGTPDLRALAVTAADMLQLRDALLYVAVERGFSHDDIVEVVCRPHGRKGVRLGREVVRRACVDGPADPGRAVRMADAFAAAADAIPEARDLYGAAAWLLWVAGHGRKAMDMACRAPSCNLSQMVACIVRRTHATDTPDGPAR